MALSSCARVRLPRLSSVQRTLSLCVHHLRQDLVLKLSNRALQLLTVRGVGAARVRHFAFHPVAASCTHAPVGLEQQVAVDEPRAECDADELEQLRHNRQLVDALRGAVEVVEARQLSVPAPARNVRPPGAYLQDASRSPEANNAETEQRHHRRLWNTCRYASPRVRTSTSARESTPTENPSRGQPSTRPYCEGRENVCLPRFRALPGTHALSSVSSHAAATFWAPSVRISCTSMFLSARRDSEARRRSVRV